MPEIWLLCEGDSDVPVLASVLTTVLSAEIIPKPAGGSSNAASAAEYVARHQSVVAAYIIDRDYRQKDVAEATLTDGKRCFVWRRHAIESYLLEPAVIVEAFREIKASTASNPGGGPAWVNALPDDMAVVTEGLLSCAKARTPQEAGRIAIQRLWEDLSDTAGRIQKRMTGALGARMCPDAAACRQAALDEAARLVTKAQETAASPHLVSSSIGQRYDEELARVSAADYLSGLHFLKEFNGRDLLSVFREWLQQKYHTNLSPKLFVRSLENAVPIVYQANRLVYGTDDFLDLANGVRAYAGLPPLP